ncbi:MAG: hypothetical protein AAGI88_25765 [Pseudomonadota bacterium]
MTSKTKPVPSPLNDETETWRRTLSILAALKQVSQEVRKEAEQIEIANPGVLIKPGYSERVALVRCLNESYASLAIDIRGIARTCGLQMPEELK